MPSDEKKEKMIATGFLERLHACINESKIINNKAELARAAGVTPSTLASVFNGGEPGLLLLKSIASALDTTIDKLIYGSRSDVITSSIQVPQYDVHLSAGGGYLNPGSDTVLDYVPFTRDFLQKQLNRSSIKDLAILQVSGDSMQPTIDDGGLVLVDQNDKAESDGIFAYVYGEYARVKRLRFMIGGKIEVISDNRALYSPEILSGSDLEQFHIIGRVCWIGHTV